MTHGSAPNKTAPRGGCSVHHCMLGWDAPRAIPEELEVRAPLIDVHNVDHLLLS